MRYAVVPQETWRDLWWNDAMALLAELTAAGNDPEKITTALHKILAHNAINEQVTYVEK